METTTATAATTPIADLLATGKTLGRQALGAIKTAIDSTLARTEATIPTLTGDAAKLADSWITDHVTNETTRDFLKGALGIAQPFEGQLDAILVAGLQEAGHVIDTRLDAFHAAA